MSRYMLISSRDPFTCGTTGDFYELARQFHRQGHEVLLFLIENGVLAARSGAACSALAQLIDVGVRVHVDGFALRQRAIAPHALQAGVAVSELERVVDGLAEGMKTLWH